MDQGEGQTYTAREAATHLSLLADHLKDYADGESTVGFCLECLGKHFSSLRGLASEGQDFFPGDRDFWRKLRRWVDTTMDFMSGAGGQGKITPVIVQAIMNEARIFRKTIQSRYFGRLGTCGASGKGACSYSPESASDGPCKCLTGYEPCCKK